LATASRGDLKGRCILNAAYLIVAVKRAVILCEKEKVLDQLEELLIVVTLEKSTFVFAPGEGGGPLRNFN
jgi:hypothetical protein